MSDCRHQFFRRWWWPRRWTCCHCGFDSRHYDGSDRAAGRPVHSHMSVAYRGHNTVSWRDVQRAIALATPPPGADDE